MLWSADRNYVWKVADQALHADLFQKLTYMLTTGNLVRWEGVYRSHELEGGVHLGPRGG